MSQAGCNRRVSPFGPVLRGGRPRNGGPDWRLIGMTGIAILGAVMLTFGTTVGALLWAGQQAIRRTLITGLETAEEEQVTQDEIDEVLTILVVGSDSRDGLTDEQLRALGTKDEGSHNLTDTIILARLDPNRDKVALMSFPRDLFVTHCDGSRGRINEAYQIGEREGIGGAECLVRTVRAVTDIPIDHFVRIGLAGFIDVVDAVGGVSFYLDEPIRDRYAGLNLPAGCVTLDGARAVGFVRARYIDNDFGRIARQQRFIRELVRQATSIDTLLQPQRMFEIVRSIGRSLETDQYLGLAQMRRIAYSFRDLDAESVEAWTVPAVDKDGGGAAYLEVEPEQSEVLFEAFRTGRFPSDFASQALQAKDAKDVPPLGARPGVIPPTDAPTSVNGVDLVAAGGPAEAEPGGPAEAEPPPPPAMPPAPEGFAGAADSAVDCSSG